MLMIQFSKLNLWAVIRRRHQGQVLVRMTVPSNVTLSFSYHYVTVRGQTNKHQSEETEREQHQSLAPLARK